MQFPIRWINALGVEIELEYAFRSFVICGSKLGDKIPVVQIFVVIVFTLCRSIERQTPVERPLSANIKTCHILIENIIEIRIVGHIDNAVVLRTVVFRVLILPSIIELPFAELMLLVDIHMPSVYVLTFFRAKQIISVLKQ